MNDPVRSLPTPQTVSLFLRNEAGFTHDQASYIASDVYQPLLHAIKALNEKIEQLDRRK